MGRGLNSLIDKEELMRDVKALADDKKVSMYITHLLMVSNSGYEEEILTKLMSFLDKYRTDTQDVNA